MSCFKKDHDRFWVLASHPELNLFAAGHDSGLIVFKLERERPAFQISQNQLFYIYKKVLQVQDVKSASKCQQLLDLGKLGSKYVPPRTLSYNPAEKAVLVTTVKFVVIAGKSAFSADMLLPRRLKMEACMNYTNYPKMYLLRPFQSLTMNPSKVQDTMRFLLLGTDLPSLTKCANRSKFEIYPMQ